MTSREAKIEALRYVLSRLVCLDEGFEERYENEADRKKISDAVDALVNGIVRRRLRLERQAP